jgi:hypothetical protein
LTKSCKHKSINQLQGRIQWLENEKKNYEKNNPDTAYIGSAQGHQIHGEKVANMNPSINYWA